jgi:hypothetical protein
VAVAIDQTSVEAPISNFRCSVTMALALPVLSWCSGLLSLGETAHDKGGARRVGQINQSLAGIGWITRAGAVKFVICLSQRQKTVETARACQTLIWPENTPHGDAHKAFNQVAMCRPFRRDRLSESPARHLVERELARTRDKK